MRAALWAACLWLGTAQAQLGGLSGLFGKGSTVATPTELVDGIFWPGYEPTISAVSEATAFGETLAEIRFRLPSGKPARVDCDPEGVFVCATQAMGNGNYQVFVTRGEAVLDADVPAASVAPLRIAIGEIVTEQRTSSGGSVLQTASVRPFRNVSLEIPVLDANDNAPEFEPATPPELAIPVGGAPDTELDAGVYVRDVDAGQNSDVSVLCDPAASSPAACDLFNVAAVSYGRKGTYKLKLYRTQAAADAVDGTRATLALTATDMPLDKSEALSSQLRLPVLFVGAALPRRPTQAPLVLANEGLDAAEETAEAEETVVMFERESYQVQVPPEATAGTQLPISVVFWQTSQAEPVVSLLNNLEGLLDLTVERDLSEEAPAKYNVRLSLRRQPNAATPLNYTMLVRAEAEGAAAEVPLSLFVPASPLPASGPPQPPLSPLAPVLANASQVTSSGPVQDYTYDYGDEATNIAAEGVKPFVQPLPVNVNGSDYEYKEDEDYDYSGLAAESQQPTAAIPPLGPPSRGGAQPPPANLPPHILAALQRQGGPPPPPGFVLPPNFRPPLVPPPGFRGPPPPPGISFPAPPPGQTLQIPPHVLAALLQQGGGQTGQPQPLLGQHALPAQPLGGGHQQPLMMGGKPLPPTSLFAPTSSQDILTAQPSEGVAVGEASEDDYSYDYGLDANETMDEELLVAATAKPLLLAPLTDPAPTTLDLVEAEGGHGGAPAPPKPPGSASARRPLPIEPPPAVTEQPPPPSTPSLVAASTPSDQLYDYGYDSESAAQAEPEPEPEPKSSPPPPPPPPPASEPFPSLPPQPRPEPLPSTIVVAPQEEVVVTRLPLAQPRPKPTPIPTPPPPQPIPQGMVELVTGIPDEEVAHIEEERRPHISLPIRKNFDSVSGSGSGVGVSLALVMLSFLLQSLFRLL